MKPIESHKKSKETYIEIIANAIGVDYKYSDVDNGDEEFELSEAEILNFKRRFLLILGFPPDMKGVIDQASDEEIKVTTEKIAEQYGISEAEYIEIMTRQFNLTEDDFLKKIKGGEEKQSSDKTQNTLGELFEEHSKQIGEKPIFTEEQQKKRKEEEEKRKHNQIDSLEKIALILSSRKY